MRRKHHRSRQSLLSPGYGLTFERLETRELLATVQIDQAWLNQQGSAPYVLDQDATTYVLMDDISAPLEALSITGRDVTLDLNGHTITYDQIGSGVANSSFEQSAGSPDQPSGWNLNGAPAAVRQLATDRPLEGLSYLSIPQGTNQNQTIVSDWTDLPANQKAMAYFIRGNPATKHRVWLMLEVEHETLGVVASMLSRWENLLSFQTPNETGRYRVRLTYVHEDRPAWNANASYALGDVVTPTTANGASYVLKEVGNVTSGSSGVVEPVWNTTLGGITDDGDIQWLTTKVGVSDLPGKWEPQKQYFSEGSYVRPTNANGYVYEPLRIHVPGAVSGSVEPNWTPTSSNVDTTDGNLKWKIYTDTEVKLDMVDVRPLELTGVDVTFYNNSQPTNTLIKNGTIRQGSGGGVRSHAVHLGGGIGDTLENLTIVTQGLETSAVDISWSNDVTVVGNTLTTTAPHKFNRHQLNGAIDVTYTDDATIQNNEIHSGKGWGGIYVQGAEGLIRDNTVYTESVITNHYGIMAYGNDHQLISNTIHADPGQGIRVQGPRHIVDDNDITIHSAEPNWDVGRLSLDGIRINDYWSGSAEDIQVRNNRITLYGNNSPLFTAEPQVLNGIANVSLGTGNLYEGNTITAVKVDPEVVVSGIMPGSKDVLVTYRNNTIISDQYGIFFGNYPTHSWNSRFESTRFVKGSNAGADYAVLAGGNNSVVRDTVFHNTTLVGGGTLTELEGPWWKPIEYRVSASLNVTVQNATGNPLSGASVTVKNALGQTVYQGTTGSDGTIPTLDVPIYDVQGQSDEPHWLCTNDSPYMVTATYGGTPVSTENVTMIFNNGNGIGDTCTQEYENQTGIIGSTEAGVRVTATEVTTGASYTTNASAIGDFTLQVPNGIFTVTAQHASWEGLAVVTNVVVNQDFVSVSFESDQIQAPTLVLVSQSDQSRLPTSISEGDVLATNDWGRWSAAVDWQDFLPLDFNGDGLQDVLGRANGIWWVAQSTGQSFVMRAIGQWADIEWKNVATGDFNGDGTDDVVGRAPNGSWWVGMSDGNSIQNSKWGVWSNDVVWDHVRIADLNGDGRDDLVGRTPSGAWWASVSNGVSFATSLWGSWSWSANWDTLRVGDMDGNGMADLVGRSDITGQWWVARSLGDRFQAEQWATWSTHVIWVDVVIADVNGDGKDDILGRAASSGRWWVAESDGSKFETRFLGIWPDLAGWQDVVVHDFDGDGDDDVLGRVKGVWSTLQLTANGAVSQQLALWSTNEPSSRISTRNLA